MIFLVACGPQTEENVSEVNGAGLAETNPPAEGFDKDGSDPEAIAIADEVMEAMGGRAAWDSYWLVMPYKLKDSGVTLTYAGEDSTQAGEAADVLELRFQNVGFTPQNKYQVYVTKDDKLVKQWAYFSEASLDTPNFITPWEDYQKYDGILLSGNRGQRGLSNISVSDTVPEDAFSLLP